MLNRAWYKVVIICCLCSLIGTGCFWRRGGKKGGAEGDFGADSEILTFGEGDGGPLGPRSPDGIPVTEVQFQNVQFAYDSFHLADSELPNIEACGDYMIGNPDVKLVAEGHCDERGSREYNLSLGEHRALAVRAYLVGLGVDGDRIQTRSFGEEQPLDPGHDESAWRANRRVELPLFR